MKTISRYIMTLALLITAATGAWAQETVETTLWEGNYTDDGVEINSTTVSEFNAGDVLRVYVTIPDGGANFKIVYKGAGNDWTETAIPSVDSQWLWINGGDTYRDITFTEDDITALTGTDIYIYKGDNSTITKVTLITPAADPNAVEVTTNAESEQDLFTEASFEMPTSDVTVNYTLVRDMQDKANPVAFSGLPSSGKIIVKKGSNGKYQPAEALTIQLIDPLAAAEAQNIIAADGITIKVLVGAENGQGAIDYDQDNPITLEDFLADMKPGYYWIKAESTGENSPYDGTVYSKEFQVLNGYELTIAAGEYATFYKDENLYTDDEDAVLYTIANVTDTEAQLSDAIKVAPAETPLLVYNKGTEEKTFLLIPTTDEAGEVTPAKEFKGSLTEGEIPASSSTADYYALNGKAFVWVKNSINIGANKCWLQIDNQNQLTAGRTATRSITGGGDTTGINAIDSEQLTDDNYYDLNGRKVEKPNRKGIYIHNGQKVVIR